MRGVQQTAKRNLPSLLYHFFGFMLLWEWLRPLKEVTDTGQPAVFVFFIGICFMFYFFDVRFVWSGLVKMFVIFFVLQGLYFEGSFFGFRWLDDFFKDLMINFKSGTQGDWLGITPVFRSLLFFILLWLMCYLIRYWIVGRKSIFFFLFLTMIYITVLDTFSPYVAEDAIVRTVAVGFLLLGLLFLERIWEEEKFHGPFKLNGKWAVPISVFLILSLGAGFLVPKAAPKWPDPIPFITSYGRDAGTGNGVSRVGYGENDSQLGGPFEADNGVVFTVEANDRHYWRIETKDEYTGKGWEFSSTPPKESYRPDNIQMKWFEATKTRPLEATLHINENYAFNHIVYPVQLTGLVPNAKIGGVRTDRLSEKVLPYAETTGSAVFLDSYKVKYEQPEFSIDAMRSSQPGSSLEADDGFLNTYTQLPESLPQRVKDLAAEITEDEHNRYDKVKAVERYFRDNGYVYETKDVEVPEEGQDYVDQFIFETKKGYCDNYSTSMVVLLRSIGIPSRWVKGYTEGEYKNELKAGASLFEITNNNAHSWVEAYFPGTGWVPFEPTVSFTNPHDFTLDTAAASQNSEAKPEPKKEEAPKPEDRLAQEEDSAGADKQRSSGSGSFEFSWIAFWGVVGVILAVGFIIVKTRNRWYPIFFILLYKNKRDMKTFFKAYDALLRHLEYNGLKRKEGQTLREYAAYVDKFMGKQEMMNLTLSYERALYRNNNAGEEWEKVAELWENLIKKASS